MAEQEKILLQRIKNSDKVAFNQLFSDFQNITDQIESFFNALMTQNQNLQSRIDREKASSQKEKAKFQLKLLEYFDSQ